MRTLALWSDAFNEPLAQSGIPIGFDCLEDAEGVAALYPDARFRVVDIDGAYFPASADLLVGKVVLAHTEDT